MSLPHLKYLFAAAAEPGPGPALPTASLNLNGSSSLSLTSWATGPRQSAKIVTLSFWFKRISGGTTMWYSPGNSSSAQWFWYYTGTDFQFTQRTGPDTRWDYLGANTIVGDGGWHHYCINWNNRANMEPFLWIDGDQKTLSMITAGAPDLYFGDDVTHYLGKYQGGLRVTGLFYDVVQLDNQALPASSFGGGTPGAGNPSWYPIGHNLSYAGRSFNLRFENAGSLGEDSSGNANHFAASEGAPAQETTDIPAVP